jgi:hypothetical protein
VQIREREEALREAEQEAARDKERIDAIIAKVNEEDRREVDDRIRRKVSPHTVQRGGGGTAQRRCAWASLRLWRGVTVHGLLLMCRRRQERC